MRPFSENIIFLDTEFSSLDPYTGEILSIGLVKLNGEELYLELEYEGETSDWVNENILPALTAPKVSREKAIEVIKKFVGEDEPYAIAYVNQFDTLYTYKLFGVGNHPFFWIPIDFASMLFAHGIDPESLGNFDEVCAKFGLDRSKFKQHYALDDAKLLREVYLKLAS